MSQINFQQGFFLFKSHNVTLHVSKREGKQVPPLTWQGFVVLSILAKSASRGGSSTSLHMFTYISGPRASN